MNEEYKKLKLPSGCRVYEGVDPEQVEIRTLKGKDEKLIAELTVDNCERKFVAVMRNILKGIDPMQMTLGDRMYVILWESINSFTSVMPIEIMCPSCLMKSEIEMDLSKVEVNELPQDFKEPFPIQVKNGDIINLRLLRVEDELKIVDLEKSGKNTYLYRYALGMVDENKGVWDRISYLENLDAIDLARIRAFHEKYNHGPVMETEYTCPKCGSLEVAAVPFRIDFLFPTGKTIERRIGKGVQLDVLSGDDKNRRGTVRPKGTGVALRPVSGTEKGRKQEA